MADSVSFSISSLPLPPLKKTRHFADDGIPSPTTPLLSHSTATATAAPRPPSTFLLSALILSTCLALAAAAAFAFLFFTSSTPSPYFSKSTKDSKFAPKIPHLDQTHAAAAARPLAKLSRPVVLLISSDGFRFGYQFKTATPNIHRLINNGTEAAAGLIPVFPTLTFPNHYSIVTGLYPPYHGIIANRFVDPITGAVFTMASHQPEWWLGEPLWETVANHRLPAATFFWPGSEVKKGCWDCPEKYCRFYDGDVPFEDRVDSILSYFDLPASEIPVFITLYFEDPDHQGHQVGPDDPAITAAVARIDSMIGKVIAGLEKRGIFEDVTLILVGDHGMVGTCDQKLIFLDDLSPWIKIPTNWVQSTSPVLSIQPPPGIELSQVVEKMNEALSSGKVDNGELLKMYLKEDLPERLHYSASYRIPAIIGMVEEGYKIEQKRSSKKECGGAHGYDNEFFSMRSIFIAHGPQFERGRKVPSFENIEIYNTIASILKIKGASNNGSAEFANSILLSSE